MNSAFPSIKTRKDGNLFISCFSETCLYFYIRFKYYGSNLYVKGKVNC